MLISCTSCDSRFLVNSADLKPNGRQVRCANCENEWFQDILQDKLDEKLSTFIDSKSDISSQESNFIKTKVSNLPSTYVKEKKVSITNSILVVLFVIIFIFSVLAIKNLETNNLVLINFYLNEFIFNIKLIINDIGKLLYNIINNF